MIRITPSVTDLPDAARRLGATALALGIAFGTACGKAEGDASEEASTPVVSAEDHPSGLPGARLSPAFPKLSFRRPVFLTHAGDGTNKLFVVEQAGRIRVFENRGDVTKAGIFLDIKARVRDRHNEEGLLALAFHPDYPNNGRFYVYYTASDPRRGVLSWFRVDAANPDVADPDSEEVILEVDQPYGNHNGATVLFGPDGYLYISLGDGGAANDPHGNGQDLTTLLGTVLRLDVDHPGEGRAYSIPPDNPFVNRPGARGEIWAYGLRNIWRMSFDLATGDLWAADVGQNRWEEVDIITRGGNYGWNLREGRHPFREGTSDDPLIEPVVEYARADGISVTGGHVYRGKRNPGLVGAYLYADYVSGRIWALRYENGNVAGLRQLLRRPKEHVSSFGEDADGEVYACVFNKLDGTRGKVLRLVQE